MRISSEHKELILDEYRFVVDRMKKDNTPQEKLYYFSALYGTINRVLNLEFDTTLALMHEVLSNAYTSFYNRLQLSGQKPESPIKVTKILIDQLIAITAELFDAFSINATPRIHDALEIISTLSYATTGNGFYLYTRGKIKIPQIST